MSNLLFIDTSGTEAAVVVSNKGKIANVIYHNDAKSQAAILNLLIEEAIVAAQLTLQDLEAICVCGGPGSYTGLRVGLSIAKGIAYALDKKLLLFDRLSLIAGSFSKTETNDSEKLIVLNARKDEVFFALFDKDNKIILEPQHAFLSDFLVIAQKLNNETLLITELENLPLRFDTKFIDSSFKIAFESWKQSAEKRFLEKDFDDVAYSEPSYLKAAFMTQPKKNPLLNS